MANISVIGTGYVGLVSGTLFSDFGHSVCCCDKDSAKINALEQGNIPIFEPSLTELVLQNYNAGRLTFCNTIKDAVEKSDIIFIAVGTPISEDGSADLSAVYTVAQDIGKYINDYKIIVDKSTVPVGTSKVVSDIIQVEQEKRGVQYEYEVVSNPEFLREGSAVYDFSNPDRIVIGCDTDRAYRMMKEVYMPLIANGSQIMRTSPATAEMIKYASNAFLAVKISYINEVANLCEKVGADVQEVAKAMGMDKRISPKFLQPGPGFGGSCFPKDTHAICETARQNGLNMQVIEAAIRANEVQKHNMVQKISSGLSSLKNRTLAVLGVTFKPLTDDMRDAPSLIIIPELIKAGATIRICDPECAKEAPARFREYAEHITYCKDAYEAAENADAIILLTHWQEFQSLDLKRLRNIVNCANFFDLRNVYDKEIVTDHGFSYYSVGRV